MKEHIVSKAYARAVISLAKENNFSIAEELTKFNELINSSNNLENVLFLDIFNSEEKLAVLGDLFKKTNPPKMFVEFIYFLVQERRMSLLPSIWKEVIVIDDHNKGFLRGVIEGADENLSDDVLNKLKAYLKTKTGKETVLDYKQTEKITAGYRVTVEDLQLDASVDNQLEQFKNSLLNE